MPITPDLETDDQVELDRLRGRLLGMAFLAEGTFEQAARFLSAPEPRRLEACLAAREDLDRLEAECDDLGARLLVRHAPAGADLREVVSSFKVASDLQRVGELALQVVRRAGLLVGSVPAEVVDLARAAADELAEAVRALASGDVARARQLQAGGAASDERHRATVGHLHVVGRDRADAFGDLLELVLVCRHLERIGDHAAAIARRVVYVVEGVELPHVLERAS